MARETTPLFLGAWLAVFGAGCVAPTSLELGTPVGLGRSEVGVDVTSQHAPIFNPNAPPSSAVPWGYATLNGVDLSFRHGLTDEQDFTARFGGSGVEAGVKQHLYSKGSRFDLAGHLTLGMVGVFHSAELRGRLAGIVVRTTAELIADLQPLRSLHLLLAPNLSGQLVSNHFAEEKPLEPHEVYGRYSLGVTGGVAVDLGARLRLLVAAALSFPPSFRGVQRGDPPPLFSGAASVQWRFPPAG